MDGAFLQIIIRVIVPLSMPVLTVILILSLGYLERLRSVILPQRFDQVSWLSAWRILMVSSGAVSLLMAASVVVLLPLLIVFFIAQRPS
jgi:ABC-type glycerol-3-phosphate transport system permease component